MLIDLDCVPCLLNAALSVARKVTNDRCMIERVFRTILFSDGVSNPQTELTPPEVAGLVFGEVLKITSDKDPFRERKEIQNREAMDLYSWTKELVKGSRDPFGAAVRLAAAGNLMDAFRGTDIESLETSIQATMTKALSEEDLSLFLKKIEASRFILYLGDNAGEIVFDRLLIELIKERVDVELVFVVRSEPTYNDVMMKDAFDTGLDRLARIIDNGVSGPLPGTIIPRCSKEISELFARADLVISKGGGNMESLALGSQWAVDKDTTFLAVAKCGPQCRHLGLELNELILLNDYKG